MDSRSASQVVSKEAQLAASEVRPPSGVKRSPISTGSLNTSPSGPNCTTSLYRSPPPSLSLRLVSRVKLIDISVDSPRAPGGIFAEPWLSPVVDTVPTDTEVLLRIETSSLAN